MKSAGPTQKALEAHRAGDVDRAERMYEDILRKNPKDVQARRFLGVLYRQRGRLAEAERELRRALAQMPGSAELHGEIGLTVGQMGRHGEAESMFLQALKLDPKSVEAYIHLGQLYAAQFNTERAVWAFRNAVRLNPGNAEAHGQLGQAYMNHGISTKAVEHLKIARQGQPDKPETLNALALALRMSGDLDGAIKAYEDVLRMRPGNVWPIAGLAEIYESMKEYERVVALIDPEIARGTPNPHIAAVFARISKRIGRQQQAVELLRRQIANPNMQKKYRSMLAMSLGQVLEDLGEYDDAFGAYKLGKDLYEVKFDAAKYHAILNEMIDAFSPEKFARMPRGSDRTDLPVFIVGMPRSGTSLVEQILSSHPSVHGAGELPDIISLAERMHRVLGVKTLYPGCMEQVTQERMDEFARAYLEHVRTLGGEHVTRVTDKMPHNFSHVGLIAAMFPGARVIHCLRNPIDVCLSCYTTQLSPVHTYATRLDWLAAAYREYRRLMDHWKVIIDIPYTEAVYEEMVENQDAQTRRLVDFVGLPFDERTLKFYESDRVVNTASVDQARKPIYKSSVARWKRFEKHLKPLIDGLEGLR